MAATSSTVTTARREARRFLKFVVVGSVGFVIDFGTFNLLVRTLHLEWPWVIVAQAISFTAAVSSNFIWNRYWTYPESRSKPIAKQFGQFFVLNTIGLALRSFLFAATSGFFYALVASTLYGPFAFGTRFATGTFHFTLEQLGYNVTLAFVVVCVMMWNFFSNRFITYSDVKFGD